MAYEIVIKGSCQEKVLDLKQSRFLKILIYIGEQSPMLTKEGKAFAAELLEFLEEDKMIFNDEHQ